MRKTLCAILATICTTAVAAGFPPHSEAQSKKVVVQLAWVVGGLHAGFFVAKEKGFYASKGLDVAINRGFGSGDTAKVVATGTAHFGEVNVPTAIISRGKELPLTVIGVIIGKAPESILSFADKGIRKPKDVEGKDFRGGIRSGHHGDLARLRQAGWNRHQQNDPYSGGGRCQARGVFQRPGRLGSRISSWL